MTSTTSATPCSRDAPNGPSCAMWICRSSRAAVGEDSMASLFPRTLFPHLHGDVI